MILTQQLTTLDTEITQLQALIEAKRQQQEQLAQLDIQTGDALGLIKVCLEDLGKVAPDAIASLKSAVMGLFDSGDNGTGDDGGNQPANPTPDTDPTPGADDEEPELISFNGETGDYLLSDGSTSVEDEDEEPLKSSSLTYAQAIKNRCSACWGYEVKSKKDIKAGFINRTNLSFMQAVNLSRTGREFYEAVEGYLNKLYYNGQSCQMENCPESSRTGQSYELCCSLELDKPLKEGSRFWHGATWSTGTVLQHLEGEQYRCQIDNAIGEVELERKKLHYIPTQLEGQTCDVDSSPLTGQACEWACPVYFADMPQPKEPSTEMIHKSANCGYLKLNADGRILAAYCWFSRKNIAEAWVQQLEVIPSAKVEMRESKRNSSWKWELKVTGLNVTQIERLSKEPLHQKPKKETPAQAAGIEPPSDWRKPQIEPDPMSCILSEGDVVEVVEGRYLGQVGTIETISNYSEYPFALTLPGGHVKNFIRPQLKLISKGEPQPSASQPGRVLLGGRIETTGSYRGLGRENAINNAQSGLQDKLAAMELMKSGLSKEEALAAVTGADTDADTDYDF
jgi:hypothetical protein